MGRPIKSKSAEAPDTAGEVFPTREYIGAMALELARMARGDGDKRLADQLDQAAQIAAKPQSRS